VGTTASSTVAHYLPFYCHRHGIPTAQAKRCDSAVHVSPNQFINQRARMRTPVCGCVAFEVMTTDSIHLAFTLR
jgi:hypothetical protein